MKKILGILVLGLFFLSSVNAEDRDYKLDKLSGKVTEKSIDTGNLVFEGIIENGKK